MDIDPHGSEDSATLLLPVAADCMVVMVDMAENTIVMIASVMRTMKRTTLVDVAPWRTEASQRPNAKVASW